jgi:type III restriction enzyme
VAISLGFDGACSSSASDSAYASMALHPEFPDSPHAILDPGLRWFPGDDAIRLSGGAEKLLPPLVNAIRRKVFQWREA